MFRMGFIISMDKLLSLEIVRLYKVFSNNFKSSLCELLTFNPQIS